MVKKHFFDETGMNSADKVTASSTQHTTAQHYPAPNGNPPQGSQHMPQTSGTNTQAGSAPTYYNYYGQPTHHHAPPSRNPQQPYYPGYTNGGGGGGGGYVNVNNANPDGYAYNQNNNNNNNKIPNQQNMAPIQAHYNKSTTQGSATPVPGLHSTSANIADHLEKSLASRRKITDDTGTQNRALTAIQENDVTHGKGSSFNHKGNEKYRHCLKKYYKNFVLADVNGKTKIARMIHNEISAQTPEGRFLVYNHNQKGWELMGTTESAEYIYHVLNDCELREKKRLYERRTVEVNQNDKKQKTSNSSDAPTRVIALDDDSSSPSPSPSPLEPPAPNLPTPKNTQETTTQVAVDTNENKSSAANTSNDTNQGSKEDTFQSRFCEKCLGTGLLPVPEALESFTNPWPIGPTHPHSTTPFPHQLSQNPLISTKAPASSKDKDSATMGSTEIVEGQSNNASANLNGAPTLLGENLRLLEEKWGITNGSTLTYPERVQQLEQKIQNQRITEETETAFVQNDNVLQMLEEAERKWGIEVPDGYNLGQRVELVEKTAFSFMSRLKVWL